MLNKAGIAPGASLSASPWQGGVGDGALPVLAEGWDNLGLPPTLWSSAFLHKVAVLLLTQEFYFFFLPEDIFLLCENQTLKWEKENGATIIFFQRVERQLKLPLMFGACQAWDQELLQKPVCSM